MNQVVVLSAVETKKKGTNKRGPWALRVFETGGGTKFQTFDVDLGEELEGQIGSTVELTYEIEDNGDFKNNVIKGWKPSSEPAPASEQSQPSESKQRSKEEVRRTESVKAAATLLVELAKNDDEIEVSTAGLFELADKIAVYVESGS